MQFDTEVMPTGYLHNVLLDGAKPFLYRSSVRSLLGIPDSGGSEIAFFHTMPPIGFTYPNFQFMGDPYLSYRSPDLAVSSTLGMQGIDLEGDEEIVAKDAQQFQSESIAHSISQAKENGDAKVMPKGIAQTSAAMPEPDQKNVTRPVPVSGQEKSLVEPSEVSERPGTVFEPATIDIPGTSKRIQNFPVLSLSEHRESFSNMPEEQFQPPLSPSAEALSSPPNIDESLLISPHPNLLSDEDGGLALKSTAFSAINAEPTSERVAQIDLGTGNGASRAADKIEQLRNAVHELAAKQSSPREQLCDKAQLQQQQLLPPVQQVVIVRQPANPARIPHAFWERSYLSRMRIRILR